MNDQFRHPIPISGGYVWIPKLFFRDEPYQSLSNDAKLLFALLQDRICLSAEKREKWSNEDGVLYIHFTLEEVSARMNCGIEKASKIMKELETAGLIERNLQQFPRAYRIHVLRFQITSENQETDSPEKPQYSTRKNRRQNYRKSIRNKTESNKTDSINDTAIWFADAIRKNIAYEALLETWSKDLVDSVVGLMVSVLESPRNEIWISAELYPRELVQYRFLQLREPHMRRILTLAKAQNCAFSQMEPLLLDQLFHAAFPE